MDGFNGGKRKVRVRKEEREMKPLGAQLRSFRRGRGVVSDSRVC